jgi:WD40 repeat protein
VVPYYLAIKEAMVASATAERETEQRIRANSETANAQEQLWHSYLAQAQAQRLSGRVGRRFESLEVLKKAVAIRPSIELRNEAIACMALADVRKTKSWVTRRDGIVISDFIGTCGLYAWLDTNNAVEIWRGADDTKIMRFTGLEPPLPGESYGATFSPDGHFLCLASGAETENVEVWDLIQKKRVGLFQGTKLHTSAFSPDNRRVAISFMDEKQNRFPIMIYDLVAGKMLTTFEHGNLPYWLRFNPAKNQLATSSGSSTNVLIWDLENSTVVEQLPHPATVQGLSWRPDGKHLAAACADANLYIWDMVEPAPAARAKITMQGHKSSVTHVAYSTDGKFLFSGGYDDLTCIWDDGSKKLVLALPTPLIQDMREWDVGTSTNYPIGLASSLGPSGRLEFEPSRVCTIASGNVDAYHGAESHKHFGERKLLLTNREDGIRIWDLTSREMVGFQAERDVFAVKLEPGSKSCVSSGRFGIKEWDLEFSNGTSSVSFAFRRLIAPRLSRDLAMSKDGQTLAFCVDDQVHLFALSQDSDEIVTNSGSYWTHLAMDGGGKLAVSRGSPWTTSAIPPKNQVLIYDRNAGKVLKELPLLVGGRVAFSPDGNWLMEEDWEKYCLWNTLNWQTNYTIGKKLKVTQLGIDFSPDSSKVALLIDRETVKLVEACSGRELATLHSPEMEQINHVQFSPEGDQLAVACDSGQLQLWDLRLMISELTEMRLEWRLTNYPPQQANAK